MSLTTTDLSTVTQRMASELPYPPRFRRSGRTARLLGTVDGVELWMLCWLPGQGTGLHDHGGRRTPVPAAFTVVSGALTEFTVAPGEFPTLDRRTFRAGQTTTVGIRDIHAVINRGNVPAVSVHAYAPRLSMMRSYLFDETGLWLASITRAGDDW